MATKEKKPRKPREKVKQGHLAGLEPYTNPDIDSAAEAYRDARNDRMALLETEMELQAKLLSVMTENNQKVYHYESDDGVKRCVNVTDLQKVAVRKEKVSEDSPQA